MPKYFSHVTRKVAQPRIDSTIETDTRRAGNVIYGAKALFAQLPAIHTRDTRDYDIFAPQPRRAAERLEHSLDRRFGGDYFYTKPALHPGTYKVMDYGRSKAAKDDENVADYTTTPKKLKTVTINGIKYVKASDVIKSKRTALKDQKSKFRHGKDRGDIALYQRARYYSID